MRSDIYARINTDMTLKEARERRGWTQEELEAKSGVTQATISDLERGSARDPRWSTVANLSKALRVKPEDLFPVELRVA